VTPPSSWRNWTSASTRRLVAGYLSNLPLDSTTNVTQVSQELHLSNTTAMVWVAWHVGADVLERSGRASYVVRKRPPDR